MSSCDDNRTQDQGASSPNAGTVALRCQMCGEQIGVKSAPSPGWFIVARSCSCVAVMKAEELARSSSVGDALKGTEEEPSP